MRGNQMWYDDITATYTDERYRLGTLRDQPIDEVVAGVPSPAAEGDRTWVFVFNDEAATAFAQGTALERDTADYNDWDAIVNATDLTLAAQIPGCSQAAITAGRYGWVGRRGSFEGISDGSINAGEAVLTSATNGRWRGIAAGSLTAAHLARVVGVAQDTQTTNGSLATIIFDLPV